MTTQTKRRVGASGFTPETRERIYQMSRDGMTYREIGERFSITSNAVSGIVFRARHGYKYTRGLPNPDRLKMGAIHHLNPDIQPAKYPFAPDDTCPKFAHDDQHCDAVLAHGGYSALVFRRAA